MKNTITWEDLKGNNIVIHTPTEDIMKLVINTIVENEKIGDIKYGEYGHDFSLHKEDTCIRIDKLGIWSYSDIEFYEYEGFEIVEYEDVKHLFKLERIVKPNQIYRHFKKGDYYATLGVSKPINEREFASVMSKTGLDESIKTHYVYHTELERQLIVIQKDGELYHRGHNSEDELVIYVPLYFSNYDMYARPKNMFLSKVDKEKYPEVTQEYRMELIK